MSLRDRLEEDLRRRGLLRQPTADPEVLADASTPQSSLTEKLKADPRIQWPKPLPGSIPQANVMPEARGEGTRVADSLPLPQWYTKRFPTSIEQVGEVGKAYLRNVGGTAAAIPQAMRHPVATAVGTPAAFAEGLYDLAEIALPYVGDKHPIVGHKTVSKVRQWSRDQVMEDAPFKEAGQYAAAVPDLLSIAGPIGGVTKIPKLKVPKVLQPIVGRKETPAVADVLQKGLVKVATKLGKVRERVYPTAVASNQADFGFARGVLSRFEKDPDSPGLSEIDREESLVSANDKVKDFVYRTEDGEVVAAGNVYLDPTDNKWHIADLGRAETHQGRIGIAEIEKRLRRLNPDGVIEAGSYSEHSARAFNRAVARARKRGEHLDVNMYGLTGISTKVPERSTKVGRKILSLFKNAPRLNLTNVWLDLPTVLAKRARLYINDPGGVPINEPDRDLIAVAARALSDARDRDISKWTQLSFRQKKLLAVFGKMRLRKGSQRGSGFYDHLLREIGMLPPKFPGQPVSVFGKAPAPGVAPKTRAAWREEAVEAGTKSHRRAAIESFAQRYLETPGRRVVDYMFRRPGSKGAMASRFIDQPVRRMLTKGIPRWIEAAANERSRLSSQTDEWIIRVLAQVIKDTDGDWDRRDKLMKLIYRRWKARTVSNATLEKLSAEAAEHQRWRTAAPASLQTPEILAARRRMLSESGDESFSWEDPNWDGTFWDDWERDLYEDMGERRMEHAQALAEDGPQPPDDLDDVYGGTRPPGENVYDLGSDPVDEFGGTRPSDAPVGPSRGRPPTRTSRSSGLPPPHLMTREDFVRELTEVHVRTTAAERPGLFADLSPELQEIMRSGDWEAFSRARGYTEEEIADFRRWLELAPPRDPATGLAPHLDEFADLGEVWDLHRQRAGAVEPGQQILPRRWRPPAGGHVEAPNEDTIERLEQFIETDRARFETQYRPEIERLQAEDDAWRVEHGHPPQDRTIPTREDVRGETRPPGENVEPFEDRFLGGFPRTSGSPEGPMQLPRDFNPVDEIPLPEEPPAGTFTPGTPIPPLTPEELAKIDDLLGRSFPNEGTGIQRVREMLRLELSVGDPRRVRGITESMERAVAYETQRAINQRVRLRLTHRGNQGPSRTYNGGITVPERMVRGKSAAERDAIFDELEKTIPLQGAGPDVEISDELAKILDEVRDELRIRLETMAAQGHLTKSQIQRMKGGDELLLDVYRAANDPDWINRAKSLDSWGAIRNTMKKANPTWTSAEINGAITKLLDPIVAKKFEEEGFRALRSVDTKGNVQFIEQIRSNPILKHVFSNEEYADMISRDIGHLYGKVEDPISALALSQELLSHQRAQNIMTHGLTKDLHKVGLAVPGRRGMAPREGYVDISEHLGIGGGPKGRVGMWVPPELEEVYKRGAPVLQEMNAMVRFLLRQGARWRLGSTVYSPVNITSQAISNTMTMVGSGDLLRVEAPSAIRYAGGKAWSSIKRGGQAAGDKTERAYEVGKAARGLGAGGGSIAGEISTAAIELGMAPKVGETGSIYPWMRKVGIDPGTPWARTATDKIRRVSQFARDAFHQGDAIFKDAMAQLIAADFEVISQNGTPNDIANIMVAKFGSDDAAEVAADMTLNMTQSYQRASQAAKDAGKTGLIGLFSSFPYESSRNFGWNAAYLVKYIESAIIAESPIVRQIMVQRAMRSTAGMSLNLRFMMELGNLVQEIAGPDLTDEQREAYRKIAPEYDQGPMAIIGRDKENLTYIPGGSLEYYQAPRRILENLSKVVGSLVNGQWSEIDEGLLRTATRLSDDFLQFHQPARGITEAMFNRKIEASPLSTAAAAFRRRSATRLSTQPVGTAYMGEVFEKAIKPGLAPTPVRQLLGLGEWAASPDPEAGISPREVTPIKVRNLNLPKTIGAIGGQLAEEKNNFATQINKINKELISPQQKAEKMMALRDDWNNDFGPRLARDVKQLRSIFTRKEINDAMQQVGRTSVIAAVNGRVPRFDLVFKESIPGRVRFYMRARQ